MIDKQYKEIYDTCLYIEYEMSIIDFDYFIRNAKALKNLFQQLKIAQQRLYKWYVYSNGLMSQKHKDAVWRFLNNEIYYSELKNFK